MKTKILGASVFLFAMFLAVGTVYAGDADWLQPASITFDEPVDVNSSLKVTKPTYFLAGMHVGQQVVGGVSFLQGTVINTTIGKNGEDNPVTIGDNLRVDGRITRGFGPVIIDDDLWVTKNIKMNPGMTVDGVDISALRISDWNKAYSWGDHSLQGYLTTETDPIFGGSPAFGITSANINNWNTAFGWDNHAAAGYLTSYTETDPIFIASPAFGISGANITNWNTAYGWGNHASVGYLKASENLNDVGNKSTALNNILPDQASSSDYYLKSNGISGNPEWGIPSSWHGSDDRIKLLPSDFMQTNGVYHNYLDGFGSGTDGGAVRMPDNTDGAAQVSIPMGFRATAVRVWGSDSTNTISVYENNIMDDSSNIRGNGLVNGSEFAITPVNSSVNNYLTIYVDAGPILADEIYGGYVAIEHIPAP